jgi:hypothetical protein
MSCTIMHKLFFDFIHFLHLLYIFLILFFIDLFLRFFLYGKGDLKMRKLLLLLVYLYIIGHFVVLCFMYIFTLLVRNVGCTKWISFVHRLSFTVAATVVVVWNLRLNKNYFCTKIFQNFERWWPSRFQRFKKLPKHIFL